MSEYRKSLTRREAAALLSIWAIATAFNLTKAVHMDDPVHLYAARGIVEHPLHPFQTQILWGWGLPGPIKDITQPPLLFYGFAAIIALFGESEIALHAFMSLFTLGVIFCIFRLASLFDRSNAVAATAMLALGPALLPSQNLMTDVPVLFFHLLLLCLVLHAWESPLRPSVLVAAGITSLAACLTKYVGLVTIPLLFAGVLLRGGRRKLWSVAVPCAGLLGWGIFSYWDTGSVHLFHPAVGYAGHRFFSNSADWLVCLGALTPFSFLFLRELCASRASLAVLVLCCVAAVVWQTQQLNEVALGRATLSLPAWALWCNGIVTSLGTLVCLLSSPKNRSTGGGSETPVKSAARRLCALWFAASYLFIAVFAQFMAVRYVLLVTPVVLIALARAQFGNISGVTGRFARAAALLLTVIPGMLIAASDWTWADVYRTRTKLFAQTLTGGHTIWAVGHWGWQWYAEKNGLKVYQWDSPLRDGDYLIIPSVTHRHSIASEHLRMLVKQETVLIPPGPTNLVRPMAANPWGGYYSSGGSVLPFRFGREPLEEFSIFRVQETLTRDLGLPLVVDLNSKQDSEVVLQGFHPAEYWGSWTSSEQASINLPGLLPLRFQVLLRGRPFAANAGTPVVFRIGSFAVPFEFQRDSEEVRIDVKIDSPVRSLIFEISRSGSAAPLSGGLDTREIGFGLENVTILAPPNP